MIAALAVLWAVLPPVDPGLPTPPPPLPTYVVDGDGTRLNCNPPQRVCWQDPQQPSQFGGMP